jgi:sulfur carrier protein
VNLIVNGQPQTADAGATVAGLLAQLGMAGKIVAVEVNRQLVPKQRHAEHALAAGDRVEIVSLVGGG